jgi:transposase
MGNRVTHAAPHGPVEAVHERMQAESRPWRRRRWEIVSQALTAARKAEDLARMVGVSPATVHRVVSPSTQAGAAALQTPGKGGRRRQSLTLEHERAFLQPFLTRAAPGEITTVVQIQRALEAQIGQDVHTSPWDRLLDRHGRRHRPVASRSAQAKEQTGVQAETVPAPQRRNQPSLPRPESQGRSLQRSPSDRTDQEWSVLEPLLPPAQPGGRPRTVRMREGMNALLDVDRTGCQWRALPQDFPPWRRSGPPCVPGAPMAPGSASIQRCVSKCE